MAEQGTSDRDEMQKANVQEVEEETHLQRGIQKHHLAFHEWHQ